jgi:orotidine-5'-phosphate decarboxylase
VKAKAKLNQLIHQKNSLLCVGLDSDIKKIPNHLRFAEFPLYEFNKAIIAATKSFAVAYKPNLAFYESLGSKGLVQLEKTLAEIPSDCFTIADAKRADIGNSSELYARAFFETWNFDAVTVHPYQGHDSLEPFLKYENRMTIVLCLTSNKGSADFQELQLANGKKVYEEVLAKCSAWNQNGNVGIVVGATKPDGLRELRKQAEELVFLIPGVGTQAGDLAATVRYGTDRNKESALVNISRAVIYASDGEDFAEAAEKSALTFVSEMRKL